MQNEELFNRLGIIEGKLDIALQNHATTQAAMGKHDVRIRTVEKNQSRMLGWGAGVAVLWTFFMGLFKIGAAS